VTIAGHQSKITGALTVSEAKNFGEFGEKWLTAGPMADSTRAMRRSIFERELLPHWRKRLRTEITPGNLRAHCLTIVDRGGPATAFHVRDIVKQIHGFAILHGEKISNPADEVGPSSIAIFAPKGPRVVTERNQGVVSVHRKGDDAADNSFGHEILSALDRAKERVPGCNLE
jgi:hypothetical protein